MKQGSAAFFKLLANFSSKSCSQAALYKNVFAASNYFKIFVDNQHKNTSSAWNLQKINNRTALVIIFL